MTTKREANEIARLLLSAGRRGVTVIEQWNTGGAPHRGARQRVTKTYIVEADVTPRIGGPARSLTRVYETLQQARQDVALLCTAQHDHDEQTCDDCGELIHYDVEIDDYRHDDVNALPCFLIRSAGSPCTY